jgi:hypothetical protein
MVIIPETLLKLPIKLPTSNTSRFLECRQTNLSSEEVSGQQNFPKIYRSKDTKQVQVLIKVYQMNQVLQSHQIICQINLLMINMEIGFLCMVQPRRKQTNYRKSIK